jgi:hypothetical protein
MPLWHGGASLRNDAISGNAGETFYAPLKRQPDLQPDRRTWFEQGI